MSKNMTESRSKSKSMSKSRSRSKSKSKSRSRSRSKTLKNVIQSNNVTNSTQLHSSMSKKSVRLYDFGNVLSIYLEMLHTIKLYHWKTFAYAEHKSTDELYTELNDKIDEFVEILMGKSGNRIHIGTASLQVNDFNDVDELREYIEKSKTYLINMGDVLPFSKKENSDLLNVKDEILGILNKFTYLLTMK